MKLKKFSAIAVAVLAGGTIAASAATPKTQQGSSYALSINFSNISVVSVSDIPNGPTVFNVTNFGAGAFSQAIVDTDGSGKIDGAAFVRLASGSGTSVTNIDTNSVPPTTNITTTGATAYTDTIGDVSGKVSSSGKSGITITERYKGSGYSAAIGTNGLAGLPTFATLAGPATVQINFKSTSAPVTVTDTNTEFTSSTVSGALTGNLKPGSTLINGGKNQKISETAVLPVSVNTLENFTLAIVQLGDKFQALGFPQGLNQGGGSSVLSGSGSFAGGKAKANLKGHGNSRGASIQLSGGTAATAFGDTNAPLGSVTTFAQPVTLKGKALGQSLSGTSLSVTPIVF